MDIPELIKLKRKQLGESQDKFGKRFNVTGTAVQLWEYGKREAGYAVIEFVLDDLVIDPLIEPYQRGFVDGKQALMNQLFKFISEPIKESE